MFQNYQSNTVISFLNLLLLPNKISNDHQTNAVLVRNGFEDEILFSRIELLDFFSLYCLIVSKKIDHFLREIVRGKILL